MKRLGFFFSSNQPLVDYHARFSCPEKRFDVSNIDFSECLQSLDRHIHHILLSCMTKIQDLCLFLVVSPVKKMYTLQQTRRKYQYHRAGPESRNKSIWAYQKAGYTDRLPSRFFPHYFCLGPRVEQRI